MLTIVIGNKGSSLHIPSITLYPFPVRMIKHLKLFLSQILIIPLYDFQLHFPAILTHYSPTEHSRIQNLSLHTWFLVCISYQSSLTELVLLHMFFITTPKFLILILIIFINNCFNPLPTNLIRSIIFVF